MIGLLLGSNIVMTLTMIWKFQKLPPQIPLFFSLPTGEDQLSEWWMIFLFPILINALYFFNIFIGNSLFPNNSFVKSFLRYLNMAFICVGTFLFVRIILLIT